MPRVSEFRQRMRFLKRRGKVSYKERVRVSDDIVFIGADDPELEFFESQYPTEGISYNSYVILDEKTAVMDTVDERGTEQFFANLDEALKGRTPDYLIVQHMEPDHAANIGKLAAMYKAQGKKVLLGAADTFRAAAIDQLQIWADRSGVDIVKHAEGADPAAVVFDTVNAAKARDTDIVIIDTAGRLHNKKNLMEELAKIYRVIDRELPYSDREVLLVLDATTGQNAVNQAREFKEVAEITGIVLTKLDGTARGGVVLAIKHELGIPVKFIGVGEQIDDLQPFNPQAFADGLFQKIEYEEDENETEKISQNVLGGVHGDDDGHRGSEVEGEEKASSAFEEVEEIKEALAEIVEDILPEPDESGVSGHQPQEEISEQADEEPVEEEPAEEEPEKKEKRKFFGFFNRNS